MPTPDIVTRTEAAGVRSELVFQHSYGILAPQKDLNGTTRLLIPGVFDCFVFSLHDPKAQIGMAAQVDDITELITVFPDIVQTLRGQGGNSFRLRTANLRGPSINMARDAIAKGHLKFGDLIVNVQQTALNKHIVGRMQGYLGTRGIQDPSDETPGIDIGESSNVYLDAAIGLGAGEDDSLILTPNQETEVNGRNPGIKRQRDGTLFDRNPYIPSYLPKDVVASKPEEV